MNKILNSILLFFILYKISFAVSLYPSQTSFGTITSGTWNGSTIGIPYGGTGSTSASSARTALGLAIGTDVQAYDAELSAIAGTTSAANKLPYFTGSGSASITDFTSNGRILLAQTSSANIKNSLSLSNVENTALSTWAGSTNLTTLAPSVTSTVNFTKQETFSAGFVNGFTTLTDAPNVTMNMRLSNNFILTIGGNRTLAVPINIVAGQSGVISIRQDITGSRTLAYAWPFVFIGGAAPTLSTGKLVLDQLMYQVNSYATSTVTITIAAPGVVTWTAHGLISGQRVQFTTTGALPTGISANTTYWITVVDSNTFKLSTSLANAQAGTFITTSGSQSGTHTAVQTSITVVINPGIN